MQSSDNQKINDRVIVNKYQYLVFSLINFTTFALVFSKKSSENESGYRSWKLSA